MFECYTHNPKCEWIDGDLVGFVKQYNDMNVTSYALDVCLDRPKKNAGDPQPEPEVCVRGRGGEQAMVIERKSVAWPLDYIEHHKKEHTLFDLAEVLAPHLIGGEFVLTIDAEGVRKQNPFEIRASAQEIANRILSSSTKAVGGTAPLRWRLRRAMPGEFEEPHTVVVSISDRSDLLDFAAHENAVRGAMEELERLLVDAARKFVRYEGFLRVVVLKFFGTILFEDDEKRIVCAASVPDCIDQVWLTMKDFYTSDDFELGYVRVR